jgi:hypothetical protein
MRHSPGRRCPRTLMACLLLSLIAVPDGLAGEWESMQESVESKLKAHARRIAEIEARERGAPADREARADRITRDRISGIKSSLKGGGRARRVADSAEGASGDAKALINVSREQGESLDIVMSEWGAQGAERRKLRESTAAAQKSLELAEASLTAAGEVAEATAARVRQSDVLQKIARVEAGASEATDRLRARWQREQAAREREHRQREREAAERERGVR